MHSVLVQAFADRGAADTIYTEYKKRLLGLLSRAVGKLCVATRKIRSMKTFSAWLGKLQACLTQSLHDDDAPRASWLYVGAALMLSWWLLRAAMRALQSRASPRAHRLRSAWDQEVGNFSWSFVPAMLAGWWLLRWAALPSNGNGNSPPTHPPHPNSGFVPGPFPQAFPPYSHSTTRPPPTSTVSVASASASAAQRPAAPLFNVPVSEKVEGSIPASAGASSAPSFASDASLPATTLAMAAPQTSASVSAGSLKSGLGTMLPRDVHALREKLRGVPPQEFQAHMRLLQEAESAIGNPR
jgi:hypothetical protein